MACRQMGFVGGTVSDERSRGSNLPILLDDLNCNGTETRLIDCEHADIGAHNCIHSEDVSVNCEFLEDETVNLSSLSLSGIEISTFSPDTKDYTASVDHSVTQTTVSAVAAETAATVDISPDSSVDLRSGVNVITITVTAADGMTRKTYTVTVNREGSSQDGNLRLRAVPGSDPPCEGLVEVYLGGQWGTVCDDRFGDTDAEVVCRQLGLSGGTAITGTCQGSTSQPIVLDNVDCDGSEMRLVDCQHLRTHNCLLDHSEDVGVSCETP